jgi:hypothetical protein
MQPHSFSKRQLAAIALMLDEEEKNASMSDKKKSMRQIHLISLAVALWPPPDKQDELVNSKVRELIKKPCRLCFEELTVYTILFRNQNTTTINDLE